MENKIFCINPLLERAEEYGKTGFELIKLKTLDKITEMVSTAMSRSIVILIIFLSLLLLSMGAAFWLGDLLGKMYYGFFCVAGFYAIMGSILYFFMHQHMKKCAGSYFIKQILN